MVFRESETVELKEVVVDDIRKKSLPLQTAMEENYILGFGMTERL